MFFALLSIPWLTSVLFFSIFDAKCIINEKASVINCSQDFFISSPRHWVFSWLFISILSSSLLIFIVFLNHQKLNYQTEKAKRIWRKSCFGSLMFLLLVTLVYYFIRIYTTKSEKTGVAISILVFIWPVATVLLVCCLNFLPCVYWTSTRQSHYTLAWWKDCLSNNSNFLIYWLALVMYLIEISIKVISIMLDVAHEVAPLIQSNFPVEYGRFRGVMVIVIGFRLAFHLRLLSFFWHKLFHGDKDLFSEPHGKLLKESVTRKKHHGKLNKTATLEQISCS